MHSSYKHETTKVVATAPATKKQSLSHLRTLINTRLIEKTLHSNISDIISVADYITRKIETLGSIFRHKTEGLLPSLITI